jgi:chromosome segregation ATPase
MKIRKNGKIIELSNSELKRIVENSGELGEGLVSTIKGIGGMFKGTGYNYTKYAYELSGSIKDLNEELEETRMELEKILDKSNRSNMSNVSFDRLSKHIQDALEAYQMAIETNEIIIEDLEKSVSSDRDR